MLVWHGISLNVADSSVRWELPAASCFKCNVDAAFHRLLNKTSYGCYLSNSAGEFHHALTDWMTPELSVIEGETYALWECYCFESELGV